MAYDEKKETQYWVFMTAGSMTVRKHNIDYYKRDCIYFYCDNTVVLFIKTTWNV